MGVGRRGKGGGRVKSVLAEGSSQADLLSVLNKSYAFWKFHLVTRAHACLDEYIRHLFFSLSSSLPAQLHF